jgi:hypothetical protein
MGQITLQAPTAAEGHKQVSTGYSGRCATSGSPLIRIIEALEKLQMVVSGVYLSFKNISDHEKTLS